MNTPLCTYRNQVLPPSRPSMVCSTWLNQPFVAVHPRTARRCGGSHAVMVPPNAAAPPTRGSNSIGHSQPPLPVVTASQYSSGVVRSSPSRTISNFLPMVLLLLGVLLSRVGAVRARQQQARVQADDQPVPAAAVALPS